MPSLGSMSTKNMTAIYGDVTQFDGVHREDNQNKRSYKLSERKPHLKQRLRLYHLIFPLKKGLQKIWR
jgi:hypothetical protein